MFPRWIWIAVGGTAVLFTAAVAHRMPQDGSSARPPMSATRAPAPSAAEEAGTPPPGQLKVRSVTAPTKNTSTRPRAPSGQRIRRQAAMRNAVRHEQLQPAVTNPAVTKPAVSPPPAAPPEEPASDPSPADDHPGVAMAPAALPATGASAPLPVLRAPTLLTQTGTYPGDAYEIALDTSLLTPELRLRAPEGRVLLRVLVRADGTVGAIEVARSSGHGALDRAAVNAAASWRFAPATRDGEPIDAWALIPVRFVIP